MVRDAGGQAAIAGLGSVIAQARARAGLSQGGLADALGIRPSSVSQWERGNTAPTLAMFRRMVAVLGPWPLLGALLPPDHPDTTATAETADQQVQQPDRQELAGLVEKRLSDRAIGERYGKSASTVQKWRGAYELAAGQRVGVDPAQAVALWHQGLTISEIAERLGRSSSTIRKLLQDATLTYQAATQPPSSPGQDAPSPTRRAARQPVPVAAAKPAPPPTPPHHDPPDDTDVQPAAEVAGPARQPTHKERV